MLGVALNEVFVPILQKQFPEIVDFYLPPEGCSYRMAVISIKKAYPGHAKRVMFGAVELPAPVHVHQVHRRHRRRRGHPRLEGSDLGHHHAHGPGARHARWCEHTPIDYLDFASPVSGLGGKMGLDATNKWPGETAREWGRTIAMPAEVTQAVSALYESVMSAPRR